MQKRHREILWQRRQRQEGHILSQGLFWKSSKHIKPREERSKKIFVPQSLANNFNFQENYNHAPVKLCSIFVINSHFSLKLQVQQSFLVPFFHFFYFILDSSLKSVNCISFSCLPGKVEVCLLYFK